MPVQSYARIQPSRPYGRLTALSIGAVVLLLLAGACSSGTKSPPTVAASSSTSAAASATSPSPATPAAATANSAKTTKPNVLFVLTDDMRLDDMQYLPQTRQLIGDQGMSFDNEFDNVTLCCPARTSILRGQYSHNTDVLTNNAGNGGFETAHGKGDENATIATAMHDAGYETGLFGKYLNGYPNTVDKSYVPPGWDNWASSTKGNAYSEYNYTLNENGTQIDYGKQPKDYGTDVYVGQTKGLIAKAAKDGKPFFIYLAVYAPHQPATPAPQDEKAFPNLQAPRDPAFNEADVSDKPQYIQSLPLLTQKQQRNIDNLYRRRAASLQEVDRSVAALVDQLRQVGQLDNTYIIFTSDNGFHLGQHRMPAGKQTAYETDIHLPLLIRGPNIAAGTHVAAITGNIDLAPTIAALGRGTMKDNPDGRSLVPFLAEKAASADAPVAAPSDWRQAYLLEHWTDASTTARPGDAELEPDDPDQGAAAPEDETPETGSAPVVKGIPEFQGLRVAGYTYVEYSTGERELYNVVADPSELKNLAKTASPAFLNTLHQRLDDLRKCSAEACRSAETRPLNLTP